MTSLSDSLLLQRFYETGDETSFEALFLRHYDMVYGVLYRLTGTAQVAEELAQDVFLSLSQKRLKRSENIAGWLYRVAVNTGYNQLKADSRRWRREVSVVRQEAGETVSVPEQALIRQQAQQRVRAVLAMMKPRDAKILVLRESGFQYKEIAEIAGINPKSVGKLLSRALTTFELAYRAHYPDDQL